MATPELSAVVALCNKGADLYTAGHRARSAEYQKRALAAAQALGAEDCLIVAKLQLYQADSLFNTWREHYEQLLPGETPPIASFLPPFLAAAGILQRRRAAGTLLAGCCRAAEVAFQQLTDEHKEGAQLTDDRRAVLTAVAPLVGYRCFVSAASFAFAVVDASNYDVLHATPDELRFCLVLMADAAELIRQPRICAERGLIAEGIFASNMLRMMENPQCLAPHGADGARLLDSWRRLEQSGVLQRRGAEEACRRNKEQSVVFARAAAAAAAAPGLRTCALKTCGAREQHPQHFKSCAACRMPVYCCKEHQTEDWPSHKAACKAARKAAASASQT